MSPPPCWPAAPGVQVIARSAESLQPREATNALWAYGVAGHVDERLYRWGRCHAHVCCVTQRMCVPCCKLRASLAPRQLLRAPRSQGPPCSLSTPFALALHHLRSALHTALGRIPPDAIPKLGLMQIAQADMVVQVREGGPVLARGRRPHLVGRGCHLAFGPRVTRECTCSAAVHNT